MDNLSGDTSVAILDRLAVDPRDFGARMRGDPADATGDRAAIQAAADFARAHDRPLLFPAGAVAYIDGSIKLSGRNVIMGAGRGLSTIILITADSPMFDWDTGGMTVEHSVIEGLALKTQRSSPPVDYANTRAVRIFGSAATDGESTSFFRHNLFKDLYVQGFHAAFELGRDSYVTRFGHENTASYNSFENIIIRSGTIPVHWGFYCPNGSGTGNRWIANDIMLDADVSGAMFRFEGPDTVDDTVVGDIKISDGEFAGRTGATFFSVGPNTAYRSNISVTGGQIEVTSVFDFDRTTKSPYRFLCVEGVNLGATDDLGTDIGHIVKSSIIEDFESDRRTAGKTLSVSGAVARSGVFLIDLGGIDYTGVRVDFTVTGVVTYAAESTAGGIATATWIIARSDSGSAQDAISIVPIIPSTTAGNKDGFITLTAEKLNESAVQFFIEVADAETMDTQSTQRFDAQIACTGGTYRLKRL